jgi:Chaperone for flagella basal body P-ring formation
MRLLIPIPFLLAASVGCGQKTVCRTVDSDRIRAGDVAAVVPAFAALDPALEIGLAPLPGIKRVIRWGDLLQLARDRGIALEASQASLPAEICFERARGGPSQTARVVTPIPPAVRRGDKVVVSVTTGSVLLTFQSEAESSGRVGDTVMVRNPANGNRFVARVQDQGKVTVQK